MFASTIRGMPRPSRSRMARTRSTSSAAARAAHLHLDRPEALGQVLLGLAEEPVQREQEVDSPGVRRDSGIVAAEDLPEREPAPPRAKVPERRVRRRHRERRETAPPHVVRAPPHPLPEGLDPLGVLPEEERPEILQQRPDRRAPDADGVGVSEALGAAGRPHARRDELEVGDLSVRRVGEDDREGYAVVPDLNGRDGHSAAVRRAAGRAGALARTGPAQSVSARPAVGRSRASPARASTDARSGGARSTGRGRGPRPAAGSRPRGRARRW